MIPPWLQGMFNALFMALDLAGIPWNVAIAIATNICAAIGCAMIAALESDNADRSR